MKESQHAFSHLYANWINEPFPVKLDLHGELSLSPFLFAIIFDELSRFIRESVHWSMLFVDSIVLTELQWKPMKN